LPTSFTLQSSDGPTYFTDILMVAQKGKFGAAYWNEGYLDKDIRCSFDLGSLWPDKTLPAGKVRLNFLMRFADDINSAETAAIHAEDYRAPDRPAVTKGEFEGYSEDEGCTVLKAAAEGVAFTIHGKSTPRVNPAFKIKGWPGATASVALDGKALNPAASVREGTLVVQLPVTVEEDATVRIEPR
jgi:hypothetical protein